MARIIYRTFSSRECYLYVICYDKNLYVICYAINLYVICYAINLYVICYDINLYVICYDINLYVICYDVNLYVICYDVNLKKLVIFEDVHCTVYLQNGYVHQLQRGNPDQLMFRFRAAVNQYLKGIGGINLFLQFGQLMKINLKYFSEPVRVRILSNLWKDTERFI